MTDLPNQPADYVPPAVWQWAPGNGGQFANINRPTAGATHDQQLPVGDHPIQLYSLGTPNGVKVTIMLEELLAAGHAGADYDAWLIQISDGDQFGSGFVALNPNSKIPAMCDRSDPARPQRLFESGAMLIYLAEKFGAFLPTDPALRTATLSWLMWQMGSAPFVGGGFGHFYTYAPFRIQYAIDRFAMETKRQYDVLDKHLADNRYMAGDDYSIADMAIWPWYGSLAAGLAYPGAKQFLALEEYRYFYRWMDEVAKRPAVQRGRLVNRNPTEAEPRGLPERHCAADIDTAMQRTQLPEVAPA